MHIVLNVCIYTQMATTLVLPPVDKHALACKMVNSSAIPAVTIYSESIIESETVPIIHSEKCDRFPPVVDMHFGNDMK